VISYLQAAILGLLQGVTEPFPVSSLGHGVILPRVLGWDIHQDDAFFLAFLVATHLATALVLLGIFWSDWKRIVRGLLRSLRQREIRADDTDAILGWLLVTGTIPVGLIGLVAEKPLRALFASPASAAAFLVANGVMLLGAERLRRRARVSAPGGLDSRGLRDQPGAAAAASSLAGRSLDAPPAAATSERGPAGRRLDHPPAPATSERGLADRSLDHPPAATIAERDDPDARLARLSWRQAAAIGTAQAIGLVPGMSRSGATMSAGLLAGLSNDDAARFAFLLATPIIGAAALLKVPDLLGPAGDGVRGPAALGAGCAAIATYLAVKFLLRFLETNRLTPFGAYCVAAGGVLTLAFVAGA
jgi:undecaprenyl-diphosphatase